MIPRLTLATSRALISKSKGQQRRLASQYGGKPGPLEADAGPLATRVHHTMTLALAALTPLYFMVPEKYSDGLFNKTFGLLLTANITAHSWIGMNYVATDYVPKVSKALLGPTRYFNAGLAVVTFLGMAKMALWSPGGIKGVVKGIWNPKKKGEGEF